MKALKLADDPIIRKSINAKVKSLLDDAERIKSSPDWTPGQTQPTANGAGREEIDVATIKNLAEPVSTRVLTKAEDILLLRTSKLNGFKFPPWKGSPSNSDFLRANGEELFFDKPELRLSSMQMKVFDDWKRPAEALPPPPWLANQEDHSKLGPTMYSGKGIDLVQDAATDCSVVASLCACVARGERGHAPSQILRNVLYPYDRTNHQPILSENGRYILRLNFNGAYRRVDIDDRLPVSKTSRVIHVADRQTPGLLWPALVEKAYLKVRGSYDFPGSNSGTDLWILSGWIPEQIFIQSDDTVPNSVWKRVYRAHKFGDVLLTMGTGKMSARAEKETGLAGEHDYAVLDLREVDGQKLLLVKNPWCEGTSWTGSMPRIEVHDGQELDVNNDSEVVRSSRDLLNADDQLTPGTFWIDLNSVLQHFESIYLNWNPGLFRKRQDIHFSWNLSLTDDPTAVQGKYRSFAAHPQFRLTVGNDGLLWILLCRHFSDATDESQSKQARDTHSAGFISIYVYDNKGSRVFLSDNALERGPFVDSPQTLLKLDNAVAGRQYTIVPVEQDLEHRIHTFTLSTFSNSNITIDHASSRYPYEKTVPASWTLGTAGGNAHSPEYRQNPQFSLGLSHKASLSLLLETPVEHLNVHVKLLLGNGKRMESVRSRDIIVDSKDYRRGCALATIDDLDAGDYTIICSTFETGQTGPFTLRVDSTQPAQLKLLPREGAGRVRMQLNSPAFETQQLKVAAQILPSRLSKLRVSVKHSSNTQSMHRERSMLRVSIEAGRGPERQVLTVSGDGGYSDGIAGVRTDEIDLSPQMARETYMWLVVERMFTPRDLPAEMLQVEIFAEAPEAVQVGGWRRWDD
ncbi:hypothetical protein AAFC00_004138 [Neodothiora populina]|uniref:Calpain catalytic domain-containing protein n=1 Tax=Neodothiora populina TaxID=2781224 RepID=A0ABR3PIY0_9PEZI